MPTYDYRCETCDSTFEVFQSFSEDPLTNCPSEDCIGSVKKIFSAPGISFKGSGFYKNDSRSKGTAAKAETKQKSTDTETSSTKDPVPAKQKKTESAAPPSPASSD
ncbi:MAG: zinc ribbon domain-containing protein [Acidimicrobiales bacterium]|jgi:putative FmdB family regulatory protein|nr:zinc ribbon domain-containing protein [Acidimicrobiales bacterium]MDP6298982.1 zinc ribbon domain-containing protein [Acidimicrobiales bacterium]HJM28494.1 FmdB family zinc ribbon protein [Acidimicrobiales bacterium]HJM97147.1 FmdB family zinc ribbon protein [Acidimicrobiales bacterium]